MTTRYVLSPRAQADVNEIWDYTEHRWGVDQAEAYIRLLHRDIETIAGNPAQGRPCPEIRAGYHRYPSGSHVLFYHLTGDTLEIVRILHKRMDFERHMP